MKKNCGQVMKKVYTKSKEESIFFAFKGDIS